MKIFDTLGGTIVTHVAVGVGAFLLGRGWIDASQAQSLVDKAVQWWPAFVAGSGGALAVVGKYKNRD